MFRTAGNVSDQDAAAGAEVRDAIDSLPEPFREIVLLRDIEGLSYADIAQVLGCPSGTVITGWHAHARPFDGFSAPAHPPLER